MIKFTSSSAQVPGELKQSIANSWDNVFSSSPGFIEVVGNDQLWSEAKARGEYLAENHRSLGVVGIGGSSLGPKSAFEALGSRNGKQLVFFDNVDAAGFSRKLKALGNKTQSHFMVISKTGSTMETLALTSHLSQSLRTEKLGLSKMATVVTELKPSPLKGWADKEEIKVLPVPLNLGGRFSVLSPVGLAPLAFLGWDTNEIKAGACWALQQQELVTSFVAESLLSFSRDEWITLFWHYSDRLTSFGEWVQQLWAESLAKKLDRHENAGPRVSTPMSCRGATDQHSLLQQVVEGAKDKLVVFIRDIEAETQGQLLDSSIFSQQKPLTGKSLGFLLAAELEGTITALSEAKVSNCSLEVEAISPKVLGALYVFFELSVAVLGETLDIDVYDQPGVEASKHFAREFLRK